MEKNIFEGAKFGDKFVTRDGRIASYRCHKCDDNKSTDDDGILIFDWHTLVLPEFDFQCKSNGRYCEGSRVHENDLDIVSRYQKPIDENRLDELATEYGQWSQFKSDYRYDKYSVIDGFKEGYRKAKQE